MTAEHLVQPSTRLIYLDPITTTRVLDADEEIFEIYSLKAGRPEDGQDTVRGLGFLSSHKDIITVEFELLPPAQPLTTASLGKRVRGSKRPMSEKIKPVIIKVDIHQDVASLKNRKGDTGSVIWRSSLYLAEFLLQQRHFPTDTFPFFSSEICSTSHVLELGSGTGLLSILLHDLFNSWTVSDQFPNLKLIEKNLKTNNVQGNVEIEEIDWEEVVKERFPVKHGSISAGIEYDFILAVDCIYNEALVIPFLKTLEKYTVLNKTIVCVLVELRSADVIQHFLEQWLVLPGWVINRMEPEALGSKLKYEFACWIAWKEA